MHRYQEYLLKDQEIRNIRPRGWLKDQLELQLDGITGSLDEKWGSVGPFSDWIGGTDNSWERPPYWLDGLVPLAFLLEDEKAEAKAEKWVEWTLNSQRENGDFGPSYWKYEFDDTLFWPKFVMLKVLISYYEVKQEQRILDFMTRYFRFCLTLLDTYEMSGWDQAREGDFAYSIYWLYEKTREEFLLELAEKANAQALDWTDCLETFPFTRPTGFYYPWDKVFPEVNRKDLYSVMQYHLTHIVNVAMGLKKPVMEYKVRGDRRYLEAVFSGLKSLKQYHGQVAGVFAGDEHLSGTNPTQGSELCSVVELMFSLQLIYRQTKDPTIIDLLERVAYNALPGTITEDFRGHQYDQQANQIKVTMEPRRWYNNGERANLFGFEPNFGCCLANMHQGWPKFTKNAVFACREGFYFAAYMPIETQWETEDGRNIRIQEITDYPFRGEIQVKLHSDRPGTIPCHFRIPGWCSSFELLRDGEPVPEGVSAKDGYVSVDVWTEPDREAELTLNLAMEVRTEKGWYHNGMSVAYGPLVFALNIQEEWKKLPHGHPEYPDYEIRPLSPWNYALEENSIRVEKKEGSLSRQAFSKENPPVVLKARGHRLSQWQEECNSAGDLPWSPVFRMQEPEEVELVPYACTKLRISVFPWV
ncbi:MAG: glycoside hydrolase family 127 protein [Candidatus Limivivens sp.]|nr:glycoside hydrolase family 127 protein [Candidatus Limivivens sp.]